MTGEKRWVRIERVLDLADGMRGLLLRDPDNHDLPAWTPGAHIDVVLPSGLIRQYSLCGDPRDRSRYRIAVLRDQNGRGGSREIHDVLAARDHLEIGGPRNNFPLADAERYTLVAGGVGITPLLPMVHELASRGAEWTLTYTGRSARSMAFLDELARYGSRVHIRHSGPRIDLDEIVRAGAEGALYCCGPEALLEDVASRCAVAGVSTLLHTERFAARPGDNCAADHDFDVVLSSSGRRIRVPSCRSILQALLDAGEDPLFSCEEGTCGSCEIAVLDGAINHRDVVLSAEERAAGTKMLICVSRAAGRELVLAL